MGKIIESVEVFAYNYIKKLLKRNDSEITVNNDTLVTNFIISPLNVNILLSFFANSGTDKNIHQELCETLRWSNNDITAKDYNIFFQHVNEFWMHTNHIFLPNIPKYDYFFYRLSNHVDSRLFTIFNKKFQLCCTSNVRNHAESAMKVLNSFVTLTENDLAHSIVATVANIDYTLVSPFYEKDTRIMPFKTNKNDTIMVETMYQFNEIPVCVEDGFTAVNLPCTENKMCILIVLPEDGYSLQRLHKKMKHFNIYKILKRTKLQKTQLFVPKFKITHTSNVDRILNNMGVRKIFANKDIAINHHDPDTTAADYFKITTVDSTCSVNDRIFYISKFIQLIHIHFTDVAFAAASDDTDNRKSNNRSKSKNLKKRNSSALSSLSSSLPHLPSTSSDSGEDFVFDESAAKVVSNLHSNDTITYCRYRRRDCHIYHHCRCCLSHNRDNDANDGGIDVHNNTNCEPNTESFKKSTVFKDDGAQKYDCDDNDNGNDDYTTTVKPTNARSSSFVFKRKKRHASVERRRYSQTLSSIHVDRPFMFHVCTEFSTNVPFVLFSGCVVNPNITVRTSH